MPSMTAKVITYSVSLTANVKCGGTKQKSNTSTLATAAAIAGPRPKRAATNATPARNIITMLASARPQRMGDPAQQRAQRRRRPRPDVVAPRRCGCGVRRHWRRLRRLAFAGDDVDVDVAAALEQLIDDRAEQPALPPRLRRLADDDLGDIALAGEVEQRRRRRCGRRACASRRRAARPAAGCGPSAPASPPSRGARRPCRRRRPATRRPATRPAAWPRGRCARSMGLGPTHTSSRSVVSHGATAARSWRAASTSRCSRSAACRSDSSRSATRLPFWKKFCSARSACVGT